MFYQHDRGVFTELIMQYTTAFEKVQNVNKFLTLHEYWNSLEKNDHPAFNQLMVLIKQCYKKKFIFT